MSNKDKVKRKIDNSQAHYCMSFSVKEYLRKNIFRLNDIGYKNIEILRAGVDYLSNKNNVK